MFRPAVHMSDAYHRPTETHFLGRYCDASDCTHPKHVPAYRFYCVNPHCLNPAHFPADQSNEQSKEGVQPID